MTKEYSTEIQHLLLQSLITEPELYIRCQNILKYKYFDQSLQGTVKFIQEYAEKYNSVPTSEQIYANTQVDLEKLQDFTSQHQSYYLEEIEGFCRHKALVSAIIKSADLLEKNNTSGIEEMIKDALLISLHKNLGTDYFEDPRSRLLKLKSENGTISTGWASVDKKLYNIGRQELLIFLAISGGGKSVALQNITLNFALQGMNTVYITLELKEELCSKRIDSMSTGIASSDIYKRLDEVDTKVKLLSKRSGNITIKTFPANSTCARDIKVYLKEYELQKGFRPDALVVDYIDLLGPNDRRISPSDLFIKDKYVAEELRNIAIEHDLTCITASQLNRSAIDSIEYDHSHIAGGKSKIDTADNVIAIRSGPTLRDRGEIQFEYLKTRNSGGVGSKTNLSFDLETLRIIDNGDEDSNIKPKSSSTYLDQIKNRKVHKEETNPLDEKQALDQVTQGNNLRNLINRTKNI